MDTTEAVRDTPTGATGRNLAAINPFFIVRDLHTSVSYYIDRLGFEFVNELSYIDDGLWGFELTDADGYVLAFARVRPADAS